MITCISRIGNLTRESKTSSDFICTVHWQWCIKTLKRSLLIIYYQQKMTVNCLFSGFLLAWISAVSSSRNLPRKTSKSNKQLISSSEVTSRKLETKSKTIIYRADLSGRYFFVCQLKIALLNQLSKGVVTSLDGITGSMIQTSHSLSLQLEETVEICSSIS